MICEGPESVGRAVQIALVGLQNGLVYPTWALASLWGLQNHVFSVYSNFLGLADTICFRGLPDNVIHTVLQPPFSRNHVKYSVWEAPERAFLGQTKGFQ